MMYRQLLCGLPDDWKVRLASIDGLQKMERIQKTD
jgi:hypothetical protein